MFVTYGTIVNLVHPLRCMTLNWHRKSQIYHLDVSVVARACPGSARSAVNADLVHTTAAYSVEAATLSAPLTASNDIAPRFTAWVLVTIVLARECAGFLVNIVLVRVIVGERRLEVRVV